jgi:AFG3 family protein
MTNVASRRVALHEAGHTLVAWLLPQQRPVIKVSIIPRGNAGGFTQQLGKEAGDHMTDSSLFTDLCVMLGGRAAENTQHSTGAQDDLHRATQLAKREMLAFGMSKQTLLAFDFNRLEAGRMYQHCSEELQQLAEQESKLLVDEAMETVKTLFKQNPGKLEQLTNELVEKTELLSGDLERILGKRPENAGSWSSGVHPEVKNSLERFAKKVVSTAENVKAEAKKLANNNNINAAVPEKKSTEKKVQTTSSTTQTPKPDAA